MNTKSGRVGLRISHQMLSKIQPSPDNWLAICIQVFRHQEISLDLQSSILPLLMRHWTVHSLSESREELRDGPLEQLESHQSGHSVPCYWQRTTWECRFYLQQVHPTQLLTCELRCYRCRSQLWRMWYSHQISLVLNAKWEHHHRRVYLNQVQLRYTELILMWWLVVKVLKASHTLWIR